MGLGGGFGVAAAVGCGDRSGAQDRAKWLVRSRGNGNFREMGYVSLRGANDNRRRFDWWLFLICVMLEVMIIAIAEAQCSASWEDPPAQTGCLGPPVGNEHGPGASLCGAPEHGSRIDTVGTVMTVF